MPESQKQIFLARLMHERDKFELLLNRVGYAGRMTLKGVSGKWSIKDIIAHIFAYEQYIADRMNEVLDGEEYVPCRTQNALDATSSDASSLPALKPNQPTHSMPAPSTV